MSFCCVKPLGAPRGDRRSRLGATVDRRAACRYDSRQQTLLRQRRAGVRPVILLAGALALASCTTLSGCIGTASRDALRHTALVDVFAACKDSVVRFTATRFEDKIETTPDGKDTGKRTRITHTQCGSGCILHEAGYVLSNSHMLKFEGARTASLYDGTTCSVRLIVADESNDLAVLKLETGRPLKPLRLGHSASLMVGEPAIAMGNPFGIGLTMANGIISGVSRNIKTEFTVLTDMIQTDASINPGVSGGPLLDIRGELVGLCTSTKMGAENIGFAISVDHIRLVLRELLAPEARNGFVLGIQVAGDGPARVAAVAKGSPAEAAGIRVGDLVTAVGGQPVRSEIDFLLTLVERRPGQTIPIQLRRGGGSVERHVTLQPVRLWPAEQVTNPAPGVNWKQCQGQWKQLPDFDRLSPAASGTMATFELGQLRTKEWFGLKLTGYLDVPADGVYSFSTRSDDGSRLWIGDQLVVDNDGLHPVLERRGFISLKAGKHPITVAYFQGPGEAELKVFWEGPGVPRQEIPASALFRPSK